MNTKKSFSQIIFGLTIFVAFMPLAFTFSDNGIRMLLETAFKNFVCLGQVVILLMSIFTNTFSQFHRIGCAVIFLCVPLTFTFNESGVTFLILNYFICTILSMTIGFIFFCRWLFAPFENRMAND